MNELQYRKRKLRFLEEELKNAIESDSDEIEDHLKTYLKVGAIVGASLFVGFKVYRLLSGKDESRKKYKIKKEKNAISSGFMFTARQRLFAVAATLLYNEFKKVSRKGSG